MANLEHVEQLKQGVDAWNKWRDENANVQPDLREASLRNIELEGRYLVQSDSEGTYLIGANLSRADLRNADLSGANLSWANLNQANLYRADLSWADLSESTLSGSDLSWANLSEANLSSALLSSINLSRTKFSRANLSESMWEDNTISKIDLRTAKGLNTIRHTGPSHIELCSIQLPQDGSALPFLRGAGAIEEWIEYYQAHMMLPIQYHSCFISYSSTNEMVAKRLYNDLQAEGVRCWFAPEDLKTGNKIRDHIDNAIHLQDKSLLILSEHALKSSWVETEVEAVLEKERRQDREILFPIRPDESVMQATKPWAKHLRIQRHMGDFTKWKDPNAYQEAFARLLRDLKQQ